MDYTTLPPSPTLSPTPGGPTDTPTPTLFVDYTPLPSSPTPTISPTPTDCANPFVDIGSTIFYGAIHYLNCRGVVNGLDSTHYAPYFTSTRGQFAKVVVFGFGTPFYMSTTQDFVGVPPSYFAYLYIESGFHVGILCGFDMASCTAHGLGYPCYLPNAISANIVCIGGWVVV